MSRDLPYAEFVDADTLESLKKALDKAKTEDAAWDYYSEAVYGPSATGERFRSKLIRSLNSLRSRIYLPFCNDPKIQWLINTNESSDALAVAIIITGKLTADSTIIIDNVALAVLITRIGIRRFCESSYSA